jgi:hypothetical protein
MDNSTVQYAGFIVAALILIWGVIEINRRYFKRRKMDARSLSTWVHLDASQHDAPEDGQPAAHDDATTDSSEQDMQTRARQNGHYSESKRAF